MQVHCFQKAMRIEASVQGQEDFSLVLALEMPLLAEAATRRQEVAKQQHHKPRVDHADRLQFKSILMVSQNESSQYPASRNDSIRNCMQVSTDKSFILKQGDQQQLAVVLEVVASQMNYGA